MFWQVMSAHSQQNVGARQRAVLCPFLLSPTFGAALPLLLLLPPRAAWQLFSGSAFLAHMAEPKLHHFLPLLPHESSPIYSQRDLCSLCHSLAGFGGVLATPVHIRMLPAPRPLSLVARPCWQLPNQTSSSASLTHLHPACLCLFPATLS